MLSDQLLNLQRVAPELHLAVAGIVVMILDPFIGPTRKRWLGWVAFVGALLALFSVHVAYDHRGPAYDNLINTDMFSVFVHAVVILAAVLAILGSLDYLEQEGMQRGEYYALILFATAGMGILAGANELSPPSSVLK